MTKREPSVKPTNTSREPHSHKLSGTGIDPFSSQSSRLKLSRPMKLISRHTAWVISAVLVAGLAVLAFSEAASAGPEIESGMAGKCLTNYEGRITNGNRINIYTCNGDADQQWVRQSNGTIKVSGKCLDAYRQGRANGTNIILFTCNGGKNQQWNYNTRHELVGVQSGKCLDVRGKSSANNTPVELWSCWGGINQVWHLTKYLQPQSPPTATPFPTPNPGPVSSATPVATDGGTTVNTCPRPSPTAPVTGYVIAQCEDFNSGFGNFGPYSGGGGGTVVGAGRVANQCSVGGGILMLKQSSNGATCGGSMINFNQQYGYWEVRMRAYSNASTAGSKPHPVLILWPDSNTKLSELNYFETDIGTPAHGFLHCITNPSANCYNIPENSVDYSAWHVYGIQWTKTSMTGYIDGTKWWSLNSIASVNPPSSSHQTIQLDNLSGSTPVQPAEMDVDWVHMYK